jgi:predicted transcriptional regulator
MLAPESRVAFLRSLHDGGVSDVLVLQQDTAAAVLTEKRRELLTAIATAEPESMRALARHVDRDISIVSRDLDVLSAAELVDFEADGRAKRPVLAHETVVVEPIVFEGAVANVGDRDSESELPAD